MDIWNVARIADRLEALDIAVDREAVSMARWIWTDILGHKQSADLAFDAAQEQILESVIQRLVNGEPVQYIAGHAWFYGLKFKVTPDVLIPRPETEELVEWILADHRTSHAGEIRILDIGTGSGCIAIALARQLGHRAIVTAMDISSKALEIALHNATANDVPIETVQRNLLKQGLLGLGSFDIIVSNPPYVSRELAGQDIIYKLKYEPELALYPDGSDPDVFYKLICEQAGEVLRPGGHCYVELNEFRAQEIEGYFAKRRWEGVEVRIDLQGMPRMLKAGKPKISAQAAEE